MVHIGPYNFLGRETPALSPATHQGNFGNTMDSLVSAGSVLRTLDWGDMMTYSPDPSHEPGQLLKPIAKWALTLMGWAQ